MEIFETKTDIGLVREKNEDAVITSSHPRNKHVKILITADGMGGRDRGEIASNFVATSINRWFLNKDIKTLNDTEKVEQLLTRYIKKLNTDLIKKYGEDTLGTTLTLALINRNNTIIFNTGDSRAYIYKDKKLIQVTEDDSDVWMYYKYGGVKKDHLRFFSNNNIISACIGICNELCTISTKKIKNDYDMLLLFTDGVTDIVTDRKMENIIKKSPKELVLSNIVNEAVYVNQRYHIPISLRRRFLANYVIPYNGRDNASGAIYIK